MDSSTSSQTSTDDATKIDHNDQQHTTTMDSTASQTSAGSHICICSDLFELVEKQRIQLNEKDKQLQELLANMDLEKAQAIEAATNQLDRDLATAQQTILTFQMATWKTLTSADLCYYIKVPSVGGAYGEFLYETNSNYLCSSVGGLPATSLPAARFKFTKNSDGTFFIHSTYNGKYLQAETNSFQSATALIFSNSQWKFVLHYNHQPNKQPGILVDIYSLANGFFLSAVANPLTQNRIMANSRTVPSKKFLLVPVE